MAIEISGISKSFGEKQVLRGFDCTMKTGEVTSLMGSSGVGKTTLFNILLGLIPPDTGTIDGLDPLRLSAVFQEDRLCENANAVVNIRLVTGKAVSREEIMQALAEVGLDTESIGKPVSQLSGGMRRRVALLRALLAPAYDTLLLDEPFKGLDEETKARVMVYLKKKAAGKTMLIITHDYDEAEAMGGEIVVM